MEKNKHMRSRVLYVAITVGMVVIGLASRRFPVLGKYPGDALWTMMVFFGLAAVMPALSIARLTIGALVISYAVEFSQLYQAPWINAVRAHPVGHLVLGSTFNWPDLVAYTAGGLMAMLLMTVLRRYK
ncbi:DUF2809 domain-containing protein [Duganella sp. FT80W]|uniref:DUF2809 domain-containing protein n=2 Tax=Duganella guangzhouensis TaxID=2666084 RepID=A0A6I2LCX2_9BURK|nr:DUF2809 domain-containing protein [Duganella guangzhouensis]